MNPRFIERPDFHRGDAESAESDLARLLAQFEPLGVERTWAIGALISVCTEVVTLSLQQVGGQPFATITVVVSQSGRKRRRCHPHVRRGDEYSAPSGLALVEDFFEVWEQQQVFEIRFFVERFFDAVEELSSNDTATAPQQCTVAVVETPIVLGT